MSQAAAVLDRPTTEPDPTPHKRAPHGPSIPDGGLPCKERFALSQSTPPGLLPCQKLCVRCGRVTARRDQQNMPWCGGSLPAAPDDSGRR